MNARRGLSLVLAGSVIWTVSCTSYKQIGIEELPYHSRVRVTTSSDRYELDIPVVFDDTLRGLASQPHVPLDQIVLLEGAYDDAGETGVLALVVLGAVVTAVYLIWAASFEF